MNTEAMSNTDTMEKRIEEKTDLTIAGGTQVSSALGGLAFKDMSQVMEFAKLMSLSKQAVPKHLRSQPGMCLALVTQSLNWRMDPFAVANKSYAVSDRLAYEAQLIHALVERNAPIKGRLKGSYSGEGVNRQCTIWAISDEDGEKVEYTSPKIRDIKTKNSPLWTADPDQQLWYYSARAFCRRHFPDVLLGVYEKEEIAHGEIKDVTPSDEPRQNLAQQMKAVEPEDISQDPDDVEDAEPVEAFAFEDLDLEEAFPGDPRFDEGVAAYKAEKSISDCPYPDDREAAVQWCGGYINIKKAAEVSE